MSNDRKLQEKVELLTAERDELRRAVLYESVESSPMTPDDLAAVWERAAEDAPERVDRIGVEAYAHEAKRDRLALLHHVHELQCQLKKRDRSQFVAPELRDLHLANESDDQEDNPMKVEIVHRFQPQIDDETFRLTGLCKVCQLQRAGLFHRFLNDAEALDEIARAVAPFGGEWSDQDGIIERVSDLVEATARVITDQVDGV